MYMRVFSVMAVFVMTSVLCLADVEVPVKFEAKDLADLGDFHGNGGPPKGNPDWGFWGAREPIVTPEWVVFPVKGKYTFIIEAKSHQFDKENDTKNGVFAEVDLRARVHGLNSVKKLAKTKAAQQKGELLVLHTRIRADADKDEWFAEELEAGYVDPENKVAINNDKKTGIIEFKQGMKAQLAIWFTNDEWDPDKKPKAWDRNLTVKSFEILLPPEARPVDAQGKLATRWSKIKADR